MFKRLKNYVISVYQNYFEIASCLGATLIILLAILMDNILGLQACPMCMMTRYIFGIIAVIAFFGFIAKKLFLIDKFLIVLASMAGLAVTGKQIYLQNLSQEEISNLPMGCGMPLETQIEYFGFLEELQMHIREDQLVLKLTGVSFLTLLNGALYSF